MSHCLLELFRPCIYMHFSYTQKLRSVQILNSIPMPSYNTEERVSSPPPSVGMTQVESPMRGMQNTLPSPCAMPSSSTPMVTFDRPSPLLIEQVGESPICGQDLLPDVETGRMADSLSKVWPGLCIISDGVISLLNLERMKMKETRHSAFAGVSKCKERMIEALDRQRFFEMRLSESSEVHAQVAEDYERARLNCQATKRGGHVCTTAEDKATRADIIANADALVHARFETMDSAEHRRRAWEFKANRHASFVNKLSTELIAAEEKYQKTCEKIDADLAHLIAMAELLERVKTRSQTVTRTHIQICSSSSSCT
ncbi:hypothetical protein M758_UG305900 [Ceratodon purpureus]|nr:hypothetical protein M758_UG305900 [Ceratodon purpureus]